jgi:hypothetical protein
LFDELLELAIGDGLDSVVGGEQPLQQHDADRSRKNIPHRDGLLALGGVGFHLVLRVKAARTQP